MKYLKAEVFEETKDANGVTSYSIDLTQEQVTEAIGIMPTPQTFIFTYADVGGSGIITPQFSVNQIDWLDEEDNGEVVTFTVDTNDTDALVYDWSPKGVAMRFKISGENSGGTVQIQWGVR